MSCIFRLYAYRDVAVIETLALTVIADRALMAPPVENSCSCAVRLTLLMWYEVLCVSVK